MKLVLILFISSLAHLGLNSIVLEKALPLPLSERILGAKNFLKTKKNINDIGSLFLKALVLPHEVSEEEIPSIDPFSRLFSKKYSAKNYVAKRTVNNFAQVESKIAANNGEFNNYFYVFNDEVQNVLVHNYDDVLMKALYCDQDSYDEVDWHILLKMRDFVGGYADTHSMLGMFFLEGNGCGDPKRINQAKNDLAKSLIKALDSDQVFTDLYAERVACLYWGGYRHLVKPEWIEIIAKAQRADGGWADPGMVESRVHPTGLAALSLRYWLNKNEKPYFYRAGNSLVKAVE